MSQTTYAQLLDLGAGLVLVCAYLVVWRRGLVAIVRALAVQGFALAAVAVVLGVHTHSVEPVVVAALIIALKGIAVPRVLLRVVRSGNDARETDPLVNIPTSLVAAAGLTLLAYAVTSGVVAVSPTPATRAIPTGLAVVLIGFFVLASRRKAVTQVVGFLLVDNGIALVAFLATAGLPLVVELGAALDVLLVVLVLQVLAARMRTKFGDIDLDQLRELHD